MPEKERAHLPNLLKISANERSPVTIQNYCGVNVRQFLQNTSLGDSQTKYLVYKIGLSVCSALETLASLGYSHSDLKLENICIESKGNIKDAKITLIDLGLAQNY